MLHAKFPPAERPRCPKCGHHMEAADVIPGMSAIGSRTFLCAHCGNVDLIPKAAVNVG